MWSAVLAVTLVSYLPGALTFRLPIARREHRARLPTEERVFWYIVISLAISSVTSLTLAALGSYRFDRLLWVNGALSAALVVTGRARLRLPSGAARLGWSALVPTTLAAVALWLVFYVPPSEYLIGGKDPGTYMNEGIQIAQQGSLTVTEPMVASIPEEVRGLFFQPGTLPSERSSLTECHPNCADVPPLYYSSRFMGFYLLDPDEGETVGQFPHLYPVWIAIGYGINGLSGARYIVGLSGVLGVMAVYFAGAWLVGRPAAAVGALLLTIHVAQVWYSRYPNAEILLQVLVFASLLAFSRAQVDDDRFFAPLAALLGALALFAHVTAVFAVGTLLGASVLGVLDKRRPQASFLVPMVVGTAAAGVYFLSVLGPYAALPVRLYRQLPGAPILPVAVGLAAVAGVLWCAKHERVRLALRRWVPWAFVSTLWGLAVYAYFFRVPVGRLAPHDAEALRVFTDFYLFPIGLFAALIGLVVVARRSFWRGLAYLLMLAVFSCFFFYKMRVIPEHFWTVRRYLAVVLPGSLLLVGTAALLPASLSLPPWFSQRRVRAVLYGFGVAVVLVVAQQYFTATRAILSHVEYAGLIPQLEQLNAHFEDEDLVLVESRQGSDMHTLALPLAYVYGKNVLVLQSRIPDTTAMKKLVAWARSRHRKVFFCRRQ